MGVLFVYLTKKAEVHHDKPEELTPKQYTRFLCDSPFMAPTVCCFLYLHSLSISAHSEWQKKNGAGIVRGEGFWTLPFTYGSFNLAVITLQGYVLNGQLIAVGVLDLLPNVLSSVYFFYDS